MSPCKSCNSTNLITDSVTGNLECQSCGVVQDFTNFEQQTFDADGPTGTYVRFGSSGSGFDYSYRESKIYNAQNVITDILSRLGLEQRFNEVDNMIKLITENEYGMGNWFRVLVGACGYVVMRKADKLLPLTSVCDNVGCDVYELGRMVSRVVEHLELKLPDFDIVGLFDRLFKEWVTGKGNIGKEQSRRMVKQGVFLLQCMIKWYVTTGRRPVPVVVAVMVFVCELNGVEISMEDLAGQLNVAVATCKARYKEVLKSLVDVARANLPWGDDVNVKNIMKNAPIVIQYMEITSMCESRKDGKSLENNDDNLDCLVTNCLNREDESSLVQVPDWEIDDLERLMVSPECLSTIYSKYMEEYYNVESSMKRVDDITVGSVEKYDFLVDTTEYWSGNSELSKKLFLDKILEKDVGLDAMPPSFLKGCVKTKKRKEKIKAAKVRIEKIRRPLTAANEGDDRLLIKRSRKRKKIDLDWEDFVIETLLLHDVKEEEIEKGYYNTLLDLHVFQGI
ncbi:plant-specific TFIIB-related protein PTF2 [Bidens hawaiensis]|uniref:plant-specific TFIIB-related protein PTF2 n=1 Tax=Bidens hawaiensis TaxID=980011 RepID=UPI00404940EA